MMRMANIMLLRAEALNKLNRGDEALSIVNDIRSRVGYLKDAKLEVSSVNNTNEVENLILQERQLELFGEGHRWFDLMRTGHLIEVMDPIYSARQEAANVTVTGLVMKVLNIGLFTTVSLSLIKHLLAIKMHPIQNVNYELLK